MAKSSSALYWASLQRIQSLYLILASGSVHGLWGLNLASADKPSESGIFEDGVYNLSDSILLLILVLLSSLMLTVSIFLARNRPFQMRVIMLGLLLLLAIPAIAISGMLSVGSYSIGLGFFLPLVAIVLSLLAYLAIKKDDKIVRSMDRLR